MRNTVEIEFHGVEEHSAVESRAITVARAKADEGRRDDEPQMESPHMRWDG